MVTTNTLASWITTVPSLVAGGMEVSLLPANVRNLQRSGVTYRTIQDLSPTLEIVAVRHKNNPSTTLENFLEVIGGLLKMEYDDEGYTENRT